MNKFRIDSVYNRIQRYDAQARKYVSIGKINASTEEEFEEFEEFVEELNNSGDDITSW